MVYCYCCGNDVILYCSCSNHDVICSIFTVVVMTLCYIATAMVGFKTQKVIRHFWFSTKNYEILFKLMRSDSQFICTFAPYT